jgi:eukaryotic-like serine/threonine-protein kinase
MVGLDEFKDNVVASGLVGADVVGSVFRHLEPEPADDAALRLARRLIEGRWLTSYQARKLLSGATRGFFLGGYRLERLLGEGGMGKVYLATNDRKEKVAIKVLPPRKALEHANAVKRFRREMELSRRLIHPNLARTLTVGQESDVHFMVMEYIPGKSIFELVISDRHGPLRVPDAARLFSKLLDGLEAAHGGGLIHRDIKPSNVMITPDGEVKLLDMGLARALGDEQTAITRANTVLGTLDYASPEQLRDASKADARSDLYSVGCTLYFALAGHPPFEGGDIINKIFKQRMEDPPPLETVARGVPAAFAAVVRKLMSKKPEERYQSAAELKADLVRWTDPARVHAILGAEADAAQSFRPPPPELAEEDLRLLAVEESVSRDGISLRDLGVAEPSHAPRYQQPLPPLTAVVRPGSSRELPGGVGRGASQDANWLVQFGIIAAILGLLAILFIAIFTRL